MAAIPTILKGDDSGAINITLATGRSYTGATLVVAYQGVTRSFTNLAPGMTVVLTFTHQETATFALKTTPLLMRLVGQYGAEETVENAEARIRVTDCLAEVNAGGSFTVQPGGTSTDPTKVPITDVGDMAARYTLADLQAKVNQIVRVLAQRSLLSLAVACGAAACAFGGVSVQTARLDELYNDATVVTNVTGGGDISTNAVQAIIDENVRTNRLASVAYVDSAKDAAVATAKAYTDGATNSVVRIKDANGNEVRADLTAKCIVASKWDPESISDAVMDISFTNIRYTNGVWRCDYYSGGVFQSIMNMLGETPGGELDPNATQLGFPALGDTERTIEERTTRLATTNDIPTTAEQIGAATPEYVDEQNQATRAIVESWEGFLDGSNVVFSITNYISGAYNLNSAKLKILEMANGVYREVYNSRDEIVMHIDNFRTNDFRIATNDVITSVDSKIADKADRAWGKYTSAGGVAPSNTVYMTAPSTVFAGGLEYKRVAVGEGAVGILTTHGAPVYTTGDEGTFKFQDDGGTNYFGFAKTDSYVIGCNTDGISVQNNIVTLTYNVTMSGVPCIWYCPSLDVHPIVWEQLNTPDGQPIAGASHTVTWEASPAAGTEVCYLNCPEAKGFFKATIEVDGSAKFMTNMPADLLGGIICTNTATGVNGIIRPSFNGSSVIWTWSGL